MRKLLTYLLLTLTLFSCDTLDDNRVPLRPVNIVFATEANWQIYGKVTGALMYNEFIKDLNEPSYFPWLASTYTGFSGVLLVCDAFGTPHAYDLCCPVENKQSVRVKISKDDEMLAVCPECGSKYNVFSLYGHPVSGPAVNRKYALRPYRVESGLGGNYRTIRNY